MRCLACQLENKDTARFCKACGASFEAMAATPPPPEPALAGKFCRQCGHVIRPGLQFCGNCGKPQNATTSQGATTESPPLSALPPSPLSGKFEATPRFERLEQIQPAAREGAKGGTAKGAYVAAVIAVIAVVAGGAYYWTQMRESVTPAAPAVPSSRASMPGPEVAPMPAGDEPSAAPNSSPAPAPAASTVVESIPDVVPAVPAVASASGGVPLVTAIPQTVPVPTPLPNAAANRPSEIHKAPVEGDAAPPKPKPPPLRAQPAKPEKAPAVPAVPDTHTATSPDLRQIPAPAPVPPQASSEPEWYVQLKSELASCIGKGNVIVRTLCAEVATVRYCTPANRWGKVPECVQRDRKQVDN